MGTGEEVKGIGEAAHSSIKQRNLPIALIIKEAVERFEEVIGARPETLGKTFNLFGNRSTDSKTLLDWSNERPKSQLGCGLLELIRVCFKDLREPDFKSDVYNQVEQLVSPLLENLDSPAMSKYI